MITIRDISKKCGVSVSTVSKALNDYGDVGSETAERIRNAAREMGYVPNSAARQLKTNSSNNIGVLFIDETMSGLTHEYFAVILNGTKDEAEKLGYDITFIGRNLGGRQMSFLEHCRNRKFDGVVIASVDFENEMVLELIKSGIPVVTIDYSFDNISCVMSDNMEGGYALASYLAEMGHKKIAFIHGEETSVTKKRMVGINRALNDHGLKMERQYLVRGRFHAPEESAKATRYLMELPDPPTAIIYPDDYSYLGGMVELEKMGLSVPDDISVVGYDGIAVTQHLRPRLTTWYQDADRAGRLSVRKLVEKIEHGATCVAEEIPVPGRLLEGGSVRRL